MRKRLAFTAAALLPLIYSESRALAQATQSTEDRLDRLERRFDESEKRHQEDLSKRDQEIARLRALLEQRPRSATSPAAPVDNVQKTTDDVLNEIAGASTGPSTARVDAAVQEVLRQVNSPRQIGPPVSFNPDIAIVSDFVGNYSTDRSNPARNRFDVRSIELDMRAAVDPRADAVALLMFNRVVDDQLFFTDRSQTVSDVDTTIEVEEIYLHLHDFGVPNLTAKLGRFHVRFGRWTILCKNDWVTVDNAYVVQSFLADEALTESGLSLSYLIPKHLVGGEYIEAIAEVLVGEGGDDLPVLNNNSFTHSPALNLHLLWNHDFGQWNVELGGSYLTGHHNGDNQQSFNLFGADLTVIHIDPTGGFNNQLFLFEAIYGDVDTSRTETQHSLGAFALFQQQLNRDFYAGVRLDWTQDALDDKREVWGVSPYVTWYWSEFLRFRLEYQHKNGDVKAENTLYFQATWTIGAHPPHPYWNNK
jgi:hypothetical protein